MGPECDYGLGTSTLFQVDECSRSIKQIRFTLVCIPRRNLTVYSCHIDDILQAHHTLISIADDESTFTSALSIDSVAFGGQLPFPTLTSDLPSVSLGEL